MSKHTPGPWKARDYPNKEGGIWIDCDAWTKHGVALGGTLATAHKTGCGEGFSVEANAHLISAAPELLAALEECRDILCAFHRDYPERYAEVTAPALRNGLTAISKAKGEPR